MKQTVFWFRRDLRCIDNKGLSLALKDAHPVLPIFIFDDNILDELEADDARVTFIYQALEQLNQDFKKYGTSVLCLKGKPVEVWKQLLKKWDIAAVYTNKDYEPYSRLRDKAVQDILAEQNIPLYRIKDQVIFEENEILKKDGLPYTIYTPYKNKWLHQFQQKELLVEGEPKEGNFHQQSFNMPSLESMGFQKSPIVVLPHTLPQAESYESFRDYPSKKVTSFLSPHLRFGTVSIRQLIKKLGAKDEKFLSELIWREFFAQILYHFPRVVKESFKPRYDQINWRNNKEEFEAWCKGKTGYPLVDAGMHELNTTGYMHNRVRMVVASFLCKHLLIDWRWGEAYFAKKLLDYDLASNNGNWQWAAGTGCDAAPYFRVFNPTTQLQKFDADLTYTKKWLPDFGTANYPLPIVEHKAARIRAIETYKSALK